MGLNVYAELDIKKSMDTVAQVLWLEDKIFTIHHNLFILCLHTIKIKQYQVVETIKYTMDSFVPADQGIKEEMMSVHK